MTNEVNWRIFRGHRESRTPNEC